MSLTPFIEKARKPRGLSLEESRAAFTVILEGHGTDPEIEQFLEAINRRGETLEEVLGAVTILREKMLPFEGAEDGLDIVGTGGDKRGTYNVSTASAFVLAGAGVKIAKHGNRAASSKSGAADVLQHCGINLAAPLALLKKAYDEAGICFLFAPNHHLAMKHVAAARKALGARGVRTIFNLLGPLINPARVQRHIIGVFDQRWLMPFAQILQELDSTAAFITHGDDGLDELTTTTASTYVQLKNDTITRGRLAPEEAGLPLAAMDTLIGAGAEHNAAAMCALFRGEKSAYRDIVVLNAGAGLMLCNRARDIREGAALAAKALDEGRALAALEKLRILTNETP